MPDTETQASGQAPSNTTVKPGGNGTDDLQKQVQEYKSKAEKAESDLGKIREFYQQYPDLVTFARKYTEDSKAAELVRNYINGKPSAPSSNEGNTDDDLADLPEAQKKAIERLLQIKLDELSAPIKNDLTNLRSQHLQTQIEQWRSTFSKAKGYPVDFKEVEPQIAELLQKGKAVDAEGAYKQVATDYLLKDRATRDREIKDLKVKVSMSRASVPQKLAVRGKGEVKTMHQAMAEAIEELGLEEK